MKYAELRRRWHLAEQQAAGARREADIANGVLLGLTREDEECGHRTIRRDDLPCPHPSCSRRVGDVLRTQRALPLRSYDSTETLPAIYVETADFRRERYIHPAGDIWAWRFLP